VLVRWDPDPSPFKLRAIEQVQLAGLVVADAYDRVDRQQRREAADRAGQRAEDSKFSAIVAIVRIEGVADETAVAGLRAEEPNLSLELDGRGRDQRYASSHACVADSEPSGEIVAAVDDQIMATEQATRVVTSDPLLDGPRLNESIQTPDEGRRELGLGLSRVTFAEQGLAMKVRDLDDIRIDHRHSANATAGKRGDHRAADPTGADHRDIRCLQLALSDSADVGQHDMSRVPIQLLVGEGHCPVEPKPPAPRVVSPSVSTSRKAALVTGAGTSWAIRSPRRTSNDSLPRLARITFTSPR